MNNVILIGRISTDVDTRYTPKSQTAVTTFSVAVDRPSKDKSTDFPRIKVFGKQAETCEKYCYKGQKVAIDGYIQTGSYQSRNGDTVYTTDVVANRIEFLEYGSKGKAKKEDPKDDEEEFEKVAAEVPEDAFEQIEADVPF